MSANGIIKGIVTAAVICALGAGGWAVYRHYGGTVTDRTEKVYVQKVATINTVDGANLFATRFSGIIVAQKTVDVKYDTSKQIDEILVKEGDHVKEGDKLLTYNVEQIQLKIEEKELEIESLQNQIKTNELEIASLQQSIRESTGDAQASYTMKLLGLQSDNARSEYDIKTKNIDLNKLKNSLSSAFVTAPISGTVKDLKELSALSGSDNSGYGYGYGMGNESADVVMKIAAEGDFRVKGVFNEQNASGVHEGAKVFLKSRVDDTECRGIINEIDTTPQQDNNSMYYGYDEQNNSSKYAFYVEPDSLEGFMLGQHILIEMDNGQEDEDKKEGIWIYRSFIGVDDKNTFVWVKNSRDQIEKRIVTIGESDNENNDCQILSGLEIDDYIAFPADYIEAGMKTTTNQSDKDIPENTDLGLQDGGMDMPYDDGMGMMEEDAVYDENGNLIYSDEEGNTYTFDPEGNLIEGGEELFGQEGEPDSADAGNAEEGSADTPEPAEDVPEAEQLPIE